MSRKNIYGHLTEAFLDSREGGDAYYKHTDRMSREGLHSKSDIAGELAWRDMQITTLRERVRVLEADNLNHTDVLREIRGAIRPIVANSSDILELATITTPDTGGGV